jgi:uncharacterized membrane protein
MNNSRLPALVFLLMLALAVVQWAQVYPQLPEYMASHFVADGRPNGWQNKQDFFLTPVVMVALVAFVTFVLPWALSFMPKELVNLPNKSYWLSPERRKESSRILAGHMAWFGCGLLFVVLYAIFQAINSNLPNHKQFDAQGMWYVLAAFITFAILVFVHMLRYFYKLPPAAEQSPNQTQ